MHIYICILCIIFMHRLHSLVSVTMTELPPIPVLKWTSDNSNVIPPMCGVGSRVPDSLYVIMYIYYV